MLAVKDDLAVCRATPADFPACLPLLSDLHHGDIGETMQACFAEFCTTPHTVALIAKRDKEIIGLIAGIEVPDLDFEAHAAAVNVIIVKQAYRRQGIGRALMEAFAQWACERGCVAVLQTTGREEARRFLRAADFTSRGPWCHVRYLVAYGVSPREERLRQ